MEDTLEWNICGRLKARVKVNVLPYVLSYCTSRNMTIRQDMQLYASEVYMEKPFSLIRDTFRYLKRVLIQCLKALYCVWPIWVSPVPA